MLVQFQQTQNICIAFVQHRSTIVQILYKSVVFTGVLVHRLWRCVLIQLYIKVTVQKLGDCEWKVKLIINGTTNIITQWRGISIFLHLLLNNVIIPQYKPVI